MHIIDVNTSFGKRVDPDPRYSLHGLVEELDRHEVACGLAYSQQGVDYDPRAANAEAITAGRSHPQIIPVCTIDPRDSLGWEAELKRCLAASVRAVRFFPVEQGWSVNSVWFRRMLRRLSGTNLCLIFSTASRWELPGEIAEATMHTGLPVVLTDTSYSNMAEMIAVMKEFTHVCAETNCLASVRAVEIMAEAVGAERLLYGSGAPARPMQKGLNQVLEADLSDDDKAAILGGNATRLLGIPQERLAGRPQITGLAPRMFDERIIDVHTHLGYWRFPIHDEDYDPTAMIERMRQCNVSHSVVSTYEAMRYDMAAGNRKLADAIEGHRELLGYVELSPYDVAASCAEMDKYYALPNFVGCEVELNHNPSPTAGDAMRQLMAEIAKRGRPVLFMPAGPDDAPAERQLARENPGLTIIHAHGFDAGWAGVVADTPNISVEFCATRPSHHDIRDAIQRLGPERVLFGSDQTLLSVAAAVGLYLDAQLTADERRLVLHENAGRIFKLS